MCKFYNQPIGKLCRKSLQVKQSVPNGINTRQSLAKNEAVIKRFKALDDSRAWKQRVQDAFKKGGVTEDLQKNSKSLTEDLNDVLGDVVFALEDQITAERRRKKAKAKAEYFTPEKVKHMKDGLVSLRKKLTKDNTDAVIKGIKGLDNSAYWNKIVHDTLHEDGIYSVSEYTEKVDAKQEAYRALADASDAVGDSDGSLDHSQDAGFMANLGGELDDCPLQYIIPDKLENPQKYVKNALDEPGLTEDDHMGVIEDVIDSLNAIRDYDTQGEA